MAKTRGLLADRTGCIIAIDIAAKFDPKDSMTRTELEECRAYWQRLQRQVGKEIIRIEINQQGLRNNPIALR